MWTLIEIDDSLPAKYVRVMNPQSLVTEIQKVMMQHQKLLLIPILRRSKFEKWLQLELAHTIANESGVERTMQIEAQLPDGGFADLLVTESGVKKYIELKTCNTSYRVAGVEPRTRPITNNIASVIADGFKLAEARVDGLVGFVLFPLPPDLTDIRFEAYITRIKTMLNLEDGDFASSRFSIESDGSIVPIYVGAFSVSKISVFPAE